jgi:serine/threonine protein kinase
MKYCDECHSTYPPDFTTCPKDKSALRSLTELTPGAILRDKYEVLERIGTGGMATVYKARHVTFNEIKALKLVSNKLMDDQEFLRRFRTEAIITRKLHHPNAVALDDFDTTADGRPFIVMEYVQGRSLRSWIHDLGSLPPQRALNIAKQVAAALGAAHKLGIVHRDIKPDNIIVLPQNGGNDVVKVFDFGIAKMHKGGADIAGDHATTKTGMVVGTPQYVSPEQASGRIGDQIDGRSDLYSLGVVLYEMLTGRLPFKSDTPVGYLIHHLQTAPTPPQALRPPAHLNDGISALLMKALEKDRDLRFQSADEMIAALEKPYNVPARTTVMGSDTTVVASAQGGHTRASAAPARATAHKAASARPSNRPVQTATTPAQWASASASTAQAAPGTVYEGPDETVWQPKAHAHFNWKKFAGPAAVVLILIIGIGYFARRSAENAAPSQVSTSDQDAALKQAIQDEFQDSDSLKNQKIDIRVDNGNVSLHGKVNKAYLTEIAGALARDVDGVKNVQNEIEVVEVPEQREQVWRSQANNQSQPAPAQTTRPLSAATNQAAPTPADRTFIQNAVRQFNMRGAMRLNRGDYNGAQRAFRNALRLDPNNRAAQQGLKRAQAAGGGK